MRTTTYRQYEPSWHAVQIVLGFLAAMVVGDWIVGWVDLPDHYTGRNIVRDKLALYDESPRTPDVVYLGTSHEWCAIDPATVDEVLRETGDVPFESLNLASSAASTITNYLLARRIVQGERHPKLVYLGVSPASSDANDPDTLLNGLRSLGEFRDLPLALSCNRGLFWETLTTSVLASYYRWEDIRSYTRRTVLGAQATSWSRMKYTSRGWARWSVPPAPLPRTSPPRVDSATLSRMTAGVSAHGPLAAALQETVELLKAAGIKVRLLEIPVTSIAAPWSSPKTNAPYRAMVDRIALATRTPIVRVPRDVIDDDDFFDPVHLRAHGARKLSRWLATDITAALQ